MCGLIQTFPANSVADAEAEVYILPAFLPPPPFHCFRGLILFFPFLPIPCFPEFLSEPNRSMSFIRPDTRLRTGYLEPELRTNRLIFQANLSNSDTKHTHTEQNVIKLFRFKFSGLTLKLKTEI